MVTRFFCLKPNRDLGENAGKDKLDAEKTIRTTEDIEAPNLAEP